MGFPDRVRLAAQARGLLLRSRTNVLVLAPPLVITEAEIAATRA